MENVNKLIAQFMGAKKVETRGSLQPNGFVLVKNDGDKVFFYEDSLPYDTSWDWLIPVISRVMKTAVEIGVDIFDGDKEEDVFGIEDGIWDDDIGLTYDCVVNLINYLNNCQVDDIESGTLTINK